MNTRKIIFCVPGEFDFLDSITIISNGQSDGRGKQIWKHNVVKKIIFLRHLLNDQSVHKELNECKKLIQSKPISLIDIINVSLIVSPWVSGLG